MEKKKQKRIINGDDITYFKYIHDGYCPMMQIIKSFNGKRQMIKFSMWDDFSFEGYISDDKIMSESKDLELTIDSKDPIYLNLNRLLGKDDEVIIDDDHTIGVNIKTMKIYRNGSEIKIYFKNDEENPEIMGKFYIFIKNIMEDGRSKMITRDDNMKKRLIDFFNGVREEFLEKEEVTWEQ